MKNRRAENPPAFQRPANHDLLNPLFILPLVFQAIPRIYARESIPIGRLCIFIIARHNI